MVKFTSQSQDAALVLNAVIFHPAEFEMTTIVEVLTPGEQRCDKALVKHLPVWFVAFFFFGQRVVGILLATPSCISAEF